MEVVEPYHPKRFLRLLDYFQGIPSSPYCPLEENRGCTILKYSVEYGFVLESWER
ncbi:hypothetical protein Syun_021043 [Stephania yunnanensis]|uniref:Uncharacterized protein n=1 Tax=Stephania yunnanensis TaxID=152371 RepID=A0AAP0IF14_9MAGN